MSDIDDLFASIFANPGEEDTEEGDGEEENLTEGLAARAVQKKPNGTIKPTE